MFCLYWWKRLRLPMQVHTGPSWGNIWIDQQSSQGHQALRSVPKRKRKWWRILLKLLQNDELLIWAHLLATYRCVVCDGLFVLAFLVQPVSIGHECRKNAFWFSTLTVSFCVWHFWRKINLLYSVFFSFAALQLFQPVTRLRSPVVSIETVLTNSACQTAPPTGYHQNRFSPE